jgi:hypothetical protein
MHLHAFTFCYLHTGCCALRWKIEQFHRETKQLTGLEGCLCRQARIVRNYIGCAILVWIRLKQVAHETQRTIYQVKHGLLSDYLRQQLTVTCDSDDTCVNPIDNY